MKKQNFFGVMLCIGLVFTVVSCAGKTEKAQTEVESAVEKTENTESNIFARIGNWVKTNPGWAILIYIGVGLLIVGLKIVSGNCEDGPDFGEFLIVLFWPIWLLYCFVMFLLGLMDIVLSPPPPSRGCFITTAVCKTLHKPDNCLELTKFRHFRDTFMQTTPEMREEVAEYYIIAPKICEKIDAAGKAKAAKKYTSIWENFLKPSFEALDKGDKQKAYTLYKNMVMELQGELLCGF
jgi:hypothetical protein